MHPLLCSDGFAAVALLRISTSGLDGATVTSAITRFDVGECAYGRVMKTIQIFYHISY